MFEIKKASINDLSTKAAFIRNSLGEIERIQKVSAFTVCTELSKISKHLDSAREILVENMAFGAWCKNNFGWSKSYTLRVREAGRAATALLELKENATDCRNKLPSSERQLRELTKVSDDKEEIKEIWTEILPDVKLNNNGQIKSASAIKAALVEHNYIDPPVRKETTPAKAKRHAKLVPAVLFAGLTKEEIFTFLAEATEYVESI